MPSPPGRSSRAVGSAAAPSSETFPSAGTVTFAQAARGTPVSDPTGPTTRPRRSSCLRSSDCGDIYPGREAARARQTDFRKSHRAESAQRSAHRAGRDQLFARIRPSVQLEAAPKGKETGAGTPPLCCRENSRETRVACEMSSRLFVREGEANRGKGSPRSVGALLILTADALSKSEFRISNFE